MSGVIYKITCNPTGLSYVGQACSNKHKNGTPYKYGASGRWNDHVSTSKKAETPIAQAIRKYGRENFTVSVLEEAELGRLDELEANWIERENTLVPNGMNVAKHGRNKHHLESTLAAHFRGRVQSATLRPICKDGENRLVYLIMRMNDGTSQRVTFGQHREHTYERAVEHAREFARELACPVQELLDNALLRKYAEKLELLDGETITQVRITTASKLIAVYISTAERTRHEDQVRVCFGGKHITREDAYKSALEFTQLLTLPPNCPINDLIQKSSQQATAP
jgi:group I intron endonuclease